LLLTCDHLFDFRGFDHFQFFIARDVVKGLEFLHAKQIAHRDLKLDNILVSNLHYLADIDISFWWSVKLVIAKFTDFGEARSDFLQTNSIIRTSTANVDRGTLPYMAPEILLGSSRSADIEALKTIDIWAYGLILFHLINPNVKYPFAIEINEARRDVSPHDTLKKCHLARHLPQYDEKYCDMKNNVWKSIERMYMMCCTYDERPTAASLVCSLNSEFVDIKSLICAQGEMHSQSSAQTINACTFLDIMIADKLIKSKLLPKNVTGDLIADFQSL
jgi:serine/threonine protein kinase